MVRQRLKLARWGPTAGIFHDNDCPKHLGTGLTATHLGSMPTCTEAEVHMPRCTHKKVPTAAHLYSVPVCTCEEVPAACHAHMAPREALAVTHLHGVPALPTCVCKKVTCCPSAQCVCTAWVVHPSIRVQLLPAYAACLCLLSAYEEVTLLRGPRGCTPAWC